MKRPQTNATETTEDLLATVFSSSERKFIARQPIFDRWQKVWAYELLFRSSTDNFYDGLNPGDASLRVIADGMLFQTFERLTEGRRAFINFDRAALTGEYAFLLPQKFAIIEILETVVPDAEVLAVIRKLRDCGYCIALDDVGSVKRVQAFLDLVQIVKVDLRITDTRQRQEIVQMLSPRRIALIAEKVETPEEFGEAKAMGFQYFQGYFFAKPQIVCGRDIPAANVSYLRILTAVSRPDFDLEEIERIIKHEAAFCYKLLRYLNSVLFGFRSHISTIRHAIVLLGEREFRRWVSLLVLTAICAGKPEELLSASLRRAFFCESLASAANIPGRAGDLFLLGLLSLIDAILDRPLADIVSELPIGEEIKVALLQRNTRMASMLQLVEAYEKAEWNSVIELADTLKVDAPAIPQAYFHAIKSAQDVARGGDRIKINN